MMGSKPPNLISDETQRALGQITEVLLSVPEDEWHFILEVAEARAKSLDNQLSIDCPSALSSIERIDADGFWDVFKSLFKKKRKVTSKDELRKFFKKNKLVSYVILPFQRKIVFNFTNNHELSIRIEDSPDVNKRYQESLVVEIDAQLIART